MGRFEKLKYGLAAILVLIGAKMVLHDLLHVPNLVSLAVVAVILAASIAWSWRATRSPSTDLPP